MAYAQIGWIQSEANTVVHQIEEGRLKHNAVLIRFAVGSALLAIMTGEIMKNNLRAENYWIPIAALYLALSYLALLVRAAIGDIDKRLTMIEAKGGKK